MALQGAGQVLFGSEAAQRQPVLARAAARDATLLAMLTWHPAVQAQARAATLDPPRAQRSCCP